MTDEEMDYHAKGYDAGCQDVYELILNWYSEYDFSGYTLDDSQRLVIERLMHHLDTKIYYERKENI